MKQYRLTEEDRKQIAHHIAQRSLANIAPGQPIRATEEYLKVYNEALEKVIEYNNKATD